jgi:RNA polymerase sigma-70 factor (ECF subfamily)
MSQEPALPCPSPTDAQERARRFELEARPLPDYLYGIAYRLSSQEAAAEDLVQEALLRAYQAFDRFEPGTNFRAWIVRILTNIFINDYRRRAYAEMPVDPSCLPPKVAPVERPEAEFSALSAQDLGKYGDLGKLRERLGDASVAALKKVPKEYRVVFLLFCLCEMSYAEISKSLEIPMGTVMSRLYRARAILRGELAEFGRTRGLIAAEGAAS